MFAASAPAQSPGDPETAPFQYLAQGTEHAGRLAEPHAERIDRIARGDQHGPLALVQRDRHAVLPLAHHRIDHPVEQHLQRAAHVAPVTGRPDDQRIGPADGLRRTVGVVLRQHAAPQRTAFHAPGAGPDLHVADEQRPDFTPFGQSGGHVAEHLRDQPAAVRASVQDDDFHFSHHPTDPSSCNASNFCASTANSIGSFDSTSRA